MSRIHLVIDARPRGPHGPLAGEIVQGRPLLRQLVALAADLGGADDAITVHARLDEQAALRALIDQADAGSGVRFRPGPPPEGAFILRTDRLYDPNRLRRALRRGRDPETAVVWRLDRPHALAGAEDELIRRRTYQPLGRFWALAPARALARRLAPTPIRPNAVTLAASALFLGGAAAVAWGGSGLLPRLASASALALALVLDTADGHLARLQGTASDFGRWLDANLDELGDMALHAAIAWAAFVRDGHYSWLLVGMSYGMGKYLFASGVATWTDTAPRLPAGAAYAEPRAGDRLAAVARLAGHADVRWHLWILLAIPGRLDVGLLAYTLYYPARALAGAGKKAVSHG